MPELLEYDTEIEAMFSNIEHKLNALNTFEPLDRVREDYATSPRSYPSFSDHFHAMRIDWDNRSRSRFRRLSRSKMLGDLSWLEGQLDQMARENERRKQEAYRRERQQREWEAERRARRDDPPEYEPRPPPYSDW